MIRMIKQACLGGLLLSLMAFSVSGSAEVKSIGPPGGWAISVIADPTADIVYAGWHGAGMMRSDDGGQTWKEINRGLSELTVVSIAINPRNPTHLYVATEQGIFRSFDRGEQWAETAAFRDVWAIAVNPDDPSILYAGSADGVIYKSIDEAISWTVANKTLKSVVTSLAVDTANRSVIYAGTLSAGVLRSSDSGQTWTSSNQGMSTRRVFSVLIDPVVARTVYAGTDSGLYVSKDRGDTWNECIGESLPVFSVAIGSGKSHDVYAGTGTGVLKNSSEGLHWTKAQGEIQGQITWALSTTPKHPERVYAGSLGGGVLLSRDGGNHWVSIKDDAPDQVVYSVLAHPTNPKVLYAATAGGGIFMSRDSGRKWSRINTGLENHVVKALVIDPRHPSVLFAATQKQFLTNGGAIFKSVNGGKSWTRVTDQTRRVFSLAIDPHDTARVYAGTDDGKVLRSVDSGVTWIETAVRPADLQSATSQAQQAMHPQPVFSLEVDSQQSGTIYAGTDSGVMKSTNGGVTWFPINTGLSDLRVRSMAADSRKAGTIWVGTGDEEHLGSVFKTVDGGKTWSRTALQDHWILALTVDPRNETIYAGTERGVFESHDNGSSWRQLEGAATMGYVLSIALDRFRPEIVYAGTEGKSAFVLTNAEAGHKNRKDTL